MRYTETLAIALDSLLKHKTRALLTMLGIIIGVGAVIAMVAIGAGASASVEAQIASMGTNVLMIFPAAMTPGGVSTGAGAGTNMTLDDVQALLDEAPAVGMASPTCRTNKQIVAGNLNWMTSVQGGYPDYLKIRDWKIASGESFTDQDERGGTKVCLIGQTVATNLFPDQDPVGQTIRIGKLPFKVLGTLATKGQTAMGQDQDDLIIAPFSTVQRKLMGIDHMSMMVVSAASKEQIADAQTQIKQVLRQRHRLSDSQEDDFNIRSQSDIASMATSTSKTMTTLLGSIASVSLLVGGIGIMNIMLVSVTERTREIGVRKSLGARRRDILQQFLVEAIMLSIVGGIIGVGLGFLSTSLIAKFANWPVAIAPQTVVMAFAFSAAVGMFFGYYPARKASALDPIDALRYE